MRKLYLALLLSLACFLPSLAAGEQVTTGLVTTTTLSRVITGDAGNAVWIHTWSCSASAVSTTTADQQCRIKIGTGTNCGTGTADLDGAFVTAFGTAFKEFVDMPLYVPPSTDVCWINAVTGSKIVTITFTRAPARPK